MVRTYAAFGWRRTAVYICNFLEATQKDDAHICDSLGGSAESNAYICTPLGGDAENDAYICRPIGWRRLVPKLLSAGINVIDPRHGRETCGEGRTMPHGWGRHRGVALP